MGEDGGAQLAVKWPPCYVPNDAMARIESDRRCGTVTRYPRHGIGKDTKEVALLLEEHMLFEWG